MNGNALRLCIGKLQSHHISAQWTFQDAAELVVSNGVSAMGHRIEPDEMRALATWLAETADRIEREATPASPVGRPCAECASADAGQDAI